jgi:Lrp/AsnC family transcriptional regulator for asnA, asnC and gidA
VRAAMISELDKKILRSLNKNARKSFREVAKEVGTSTTSIYNNVKKLEKMGVIKGYIPLLDEEVLGNEFVALISIRYVQGKWKEVIGEISKLSQVRAVYDITGDMDLVCVCYFKHRNELDEFLKTQLQLAYVERVLTNIVLNVYKDERRTILPGVS